MGRGVEEPVARVAGLEALSWTHKARDAVNRCCTGQGRGQPGVQCEGVGHWTHAAVDWCRTVERKHGGVMELHGVSVHFFLPAPFSSAVLKPDLEEKLNNCEVQLNMLVKYISLIGYEQLN